MLETGWLVGIDGGCPERSFAERPFPNIQLTLDLQRANERSTFAVQEIIIESNNKHWKKGGGRTTKFQLWSEVHHPIVVPAAFLGSSTHIRICAFALRFSGMVQGILPSGNNKVVAKI